MVTESPGDGVKPFDATNNPIQYTLLPCSSTPNKIMVLVRKDASVNVIQMVCGGSDKFNDGSTSKTLVGQGSSIMLTKSFDPVSGFSMVIAGILGFTSGGTIPHFVGTIPAAPYTVNAPSAGLDGQTLTVELQQPTPTGYQVSWGTEFVGITNTTVPLDAGMWSRAMFYGKTSTGKWYFMNGQFGVPA